MDCINHDEACRQELETAKDILRALVKANAGEVEGVVIRAQTFLHRRGPEHWPSANSEEWRLAYTERKFCTAAQRYAHRVDCTYSDARSRIDYWLGKQP